MQIVLATRDYALLHGLELDQRNGDVVIFHALHCDDRTGNIACNAVFRYLAIQPNTVADAFDALRVE